MLNKFFSFLFFFVFVSNLFSQGFNIEGFVFEAGNRGYLNLAEIEMKDVKSGQIYCATTTDIFGQFKCDLPPIESFSLSITKEGYKKYEKTYVASELKSGEKNFFKIELTRAPGYLFEITLADKRDNENQVVAGITGALIEVFNNTTEKEVMKLENHPSQEFKVRLEKGNHYTILVRKENYLAKQMEVYVNVKGCILCFDGINDVRPGVVDNLTAGNEYGVLLANVEMEKIFSGKSFEIKNIFYEVNGSDLNKDAQKELDKVINLLKFNPNLTVQIVSHTDARGSKDANKSLSQFRADKAVRYITNDPFISAKKIYGVGLGEDYPKNQCSDGVICSDSEHAVNRRTEVKIIGISDEWLFKPLVNIKNEEIFNRKLLETTNGKTEQKTGDELLGKPEVKDSIKMDAKTTPTIKKESKPIEKVEIKNEKNQEIQPDKIVQAESPSSNNTALIETEKNLSTYKGDIKNGFKILLYMGRKLLKNESEILSTYPNSNSFIDAYGLTYYFFGNFDTKDSALQALTADIKTKFSDAAVIEFKDGRIID